jgi:hypothetical protein
LVIAAISGHQQQKKNDEQISGIEIFGKQSPQETGDAGIWLVFRSWLLRTRMGPIAAVVLRVLAGRLFRRFGFGWLRGRNGAFFRGTWGLPGRFGDTIAAVGAVGLWDVSVIHGASPAFQNFSAPEPMRELAMRAILAARMAFSSLLIRSRLR